MTTEQKKLQGVWQTIEVTTTGPNASTNTNPQPGLRFFTGNHYSMMQVNGTASRKLVPDQAKATADELREQLRFAANAGTFEIKGSDIIFHPSVALGPSIMAPGATLISSYKLEGNILWTTYKANQNGPIANPTTTKMRRIE